MLAAAEHAAPKSKIGIDLGGTKTEILVLSAEGRSLLRKRVPTPSSNYDAIIQTLATLVNEARQVSGPVDHIGIGIPGAADAVTGLIKNANTTCLIGQRLGHDLTQCLGLPVKLENDANCFTLSEARDGSGAGYDVVFGVILGTGVGAGWCLHGQIHPGMHHISGEWGHNPVPLRLRHPVATHTTTPCFEPFLDLGRACYCGKLDCVETHLCGSGFSKTHTHLCTQSGAPPRAWSAQEIADAAIQGDAIAIQTLALYARQLACALSVVINCVDPDVVVLGGGLSNLDLLYPQIQAALPEFVFNHQVLTPILKATHGDSSGVRGAAWL